MVFGTLISIGASIVSSVGSAIASAVGSIGSALSSFANTVAPIIATIVDAIKPVAEAIGKFANAFLQALGILKPDERIEDFGELALQARDKGITIDKFDRFDDYMDALRKFEVDPVVAAKRNSSEKLVAGLGIGTVGVEDKFNAERGSLNYLWVLPMANPSYFTPDRMQTLVQGGRLGGDIFAYLEKRLDGADARDVRTGLEVTPDGKPMNATEKADLFSAIDQAREQWGNIKGQINPAGQG